MDFARKQLEKYGWTEGKGLGKHEDGISQALKPKLKRSVTGIGHDAASDFTEHWWSALYDKAASNVEVEEKNGKTKKIKTKDADEFEITNSTWRLKKKGKDKKSGDGYTDFFIKTAIMSNDGVKMEKVRDSESEDEEVEKRDVFKMSDEQLFAACEGRTAHKGARHGLRALGKLARIERQEQMLLKQDKYKGYSQAKCDISVNDLQVVEDMALNSDADANAAVVKKKKKKKKSCKQDISVASEDNSGERTKDIEMSVKETKQSNKSNKKYKVCENDTDGFENVVKKKKNKRKHIENCTTEMDISESQVVSENVVKKKKKKSKKDDL